MCSLTVKSRSSSPSDRQRPLSSSSSTSVMRSAAHHQPGESKTCTHLFNAIPDPLLTLRPVGGSVGGPRAPSNQITVGVAASVAILNEGFFKWGLAGV